MNAIILAAGMGTRLRPLTEELPKALVVAGVESFFSRQLRLLDRIGVSDITVVTGYKDTAFSAWKDHPGLTFVHNDHYDDRNNLWSMHLVRDRLHDTLVLEGDVWLGEDVLPAAAPATSSWFVGWKENMRNEWVVRTDENGRVLRIDVASGQGWILSGISYWTGEDGRRIAGLIEERVTAPGWENLFWDDIPRAHLDILDVRARRIRAGDWVEVDTLEDHAALEASLAGLKSPSH